MADQQQINELSQQLIAAVEQIRACERQIMLCTNQKAKTDLVMAEVKKTDNENRDMYRSIGRMFIKCTPSEITEDLQKDLESIKRESDRSTNLKTILDQKKEHLTKQLNDLTPK